MLTVEVEIRVIGRRTAAVEPHRLALDLAPGPVLLHEFISAVVRSEVAAFRERAADRSLFRVLTDGALAEGVSVGKIISGAANSEVQVEEVQVDTEAAIDAALLAHTDGLYEVVIDEEPVGSLDAIAQVSGGMAVMFIRLVALSGG